MKTLAYRDYTCCGVQLAITGSALNTTRIYATSRWSLLPFVHGPRREWMEGGGDSRLLLSLHILTSDNVGRVPVEGKSSACLTCMKYMLIILIIILIILGEILLSYVANTSRTHARTRAHTYSHAHARPHKTHTHTHTAVSVQVRCVGVAQAWRSNAPPHSWPVVGSLK